jgi:cysteine desulfurase
MAPGAVDTMMHYLTLTGTFANPASIQHSLGQTAELCVEQARTQIAELFKARKKDFIFTSGATESNNLAIQGIAQAYRKQGRHIVTSAIEHKSVLALNHKASA